MKAKTHADNWSHRIDTQPSISVYQIVWMVLRSFRWRTGGGHTTRGHTFRWCRCGFLFATKNQAFASIASPFLNEFLVYLAVEKLRGTVLLFLGMMTWHFFSVSDFSHLQRKVWETYPVLVIVMTCCTYTQNLVFDLQELRNKFRWSFQHCGKKVKKNK